MWQPLSRILSFIGILGVYTRHKDPRVRAGNTNNPGIDAGTGWQAFVDTEKLWRVWGPGNSSPWQPFHCVTLFAAIDAGLRRQKNHATFGPCGKPSLPDVLRTNAPLPQWAITGRSTMLVLDLPGEQVIHAAYALAARAGFQPVCTFDNWPNAKGVLTPEKLISAMLYYAPAMQDISAKYNAACPPMWLCDADRNGRGKPSPSQYDNRYTLEARLLPGTGLLRDNGITSIVYLSQHPSPIVSWDILPWMQDLSNKGIDVRFASLAKEALFMNPVQISRMDNKKLAVKTNAAARGLMRSSAGGFGGFVPEPSSSGG